MATIKALQLVYDFDYYGFKNKDIVGGDYVKILQLFKTIGLFIFWYKWFLSIFRSETSNSKFESKISVDKKFSKDLKYISLKEIYIFRFEVFIKSFLILEFDKFSEAFSTNRWGFGNGLYVILPDEFKYILKFLKKFFSIIATLLL